MTDKSECGKMAMYLVYWPGHDPLAMCADHAAWATKVAGALGLYLRKEKAPEGATCLSEDAIDES